MFLMGDPRNWTDRKVAAVRSENAAADKAELATCELYDHGPWWVAQLTPCETFRNKSALAATTCAGCLREERLTWSMLKHTSLSHRTWPEVMRKFTCKHCGSGPREIGFSKGVALDARQTGKLSRRPAGARDQPTR